ncbi:uncharacterized protein LOC135398187 [Ornithodoros turicata]|uniref:uncharacterized protein LOC135398187 n=1 Tax=Ornithodoros turicata TaxID=34597 RepID=UPI00313A24B1
MRPWLAQEGTLAIATQVRREFLHSSSNHSAYTTKRMKCAPLLVCLLFAVGAHAGNLLDSNRYLDHLLANTLPRFGGLSEGVLNGFKFKVKKTGLTNRDLKVKFSNGKVTGLLPPRGLRRLGDCSAPTWQANNITVSCYVTLDGLAAVYSGTYKGDNVLGQVKDLTVQGDLRGAKAYLEVTASPGAPPSLKSWSVPPFNLQLTLSRTPDLNSERRQSFDRELESNVKQALNSFLYGPLQYALANAVRVDPLPMP